MRRAVRIACSMVLGLTLAACGPSASKVRDAREAVYRAPPSTAIAAARAAFADFGVDDTASGETVVTSRSRPFGDAGMSLLRDLKKGEQAGRYPSVWWVVLRAVVVPDEHVPQHYRVFVEARVIRHVLMRREFVPPPDWARDIVEEKELEIARRLRPHRVVTAAGR